MIARDDYGPGGKALVVGIIGLKVVFAMWARRLSAGGALGLLAVRDRSASSIALGAAWAHRACATPSSPAWSPSTPSCCPRCTPSPARSSRERPEPEPSPTRRAPRSSSWRCSRWPSADSSSPASPPTPTPTGGVARQRRARRCATAATPIRTASCSARPAETATRCWPRSAPDPARARVDGRADAAARQRRGHRAPGRRDRAHLAQRADLPARARARRSSGCPSGQQLRAGDDLGPGRGPRGQRAARDPGAST